LHESYRLISLALFQHLGDDLPYALNRELFDARDMADREPARQPFPDPQVPIRRGAPRRDARLGSASGASASWRRGFFERLAIRGSWAEKGDERTVA
jgi:hypothetical protein